MHGSTDKLAFSYQCDQCSSVVRIAFFGATISARFSILAILAIPAILAILILRFLLYLCVAKVLNLYNPMMPENLIPRRVVSLQPSVTVTLRDLGVLYRPDIHGQEAAAGTVSCLIAPGSPQADKWETLWHYMQGGPSVFLGDLHYYFDDGDLRNLSLAGLDERCPLYLLTGEYDLSATPALTRELARLTGARHCEIMEGLGHFPMSESPAQFRRYVAPVLDRTATRPAG